MIFYKILIIFIIFYILILLYENIDLILHKLTFKSKESVPSNRILINKIKYILNKLSLKENISNYTFIDFGSGFGDILYELRNFFNILYGIECDKYSYNKSKQKLEEYKHIKLINDKIENVNINHNNIILYMYEPLWTMKNCEERYNMYNKILDNINYKNFYIIYVEGSKITNMCNFNNNINSKFSLIYSYNVNTWPLNKKIYIYKNNN